MYHPKYMQLDYLAAIGISREAKLDWYSYKILLLERAAYH